MCGIFTEKAPIYFEEMEDGFYCSIDGECEYFRSAWEMEMCARDESRELVEITEHNEAALRASGAFERPEL